MTCSKDDLIGLFSTLEKDEDKIDALNEQIKVIKNGPQGINAEIKEFAKKYEANERDVKEAYKLAREVCEKIDSVDELIYQFLNQIINLIPSKVDIEKLKETWKNVSEEYSKITTGEETE